MSAPITIPASTVTAILLTAAALFLGPILLLILLGIRRKLSALPLILGFLSFFVAQPLTRIPLLSILSLQEGFQQFASAHFVLYSLLIGGLTAGLFEESARLAGALLLKRKHSWKDAVSFGLGHGLCEVFLISGMAQINNLIFVFLINHPAMCEAAGIPAELLTTAAQQLAAATPWTFGLSVLERVFAVIYHIFATVLIFWGVRRRRKAAAWAGAVLCHTLFNALASLVSTGWGILAAEFAIGVMAAMTLPAMRRLKKGFAEQASWPSTVQPSGQ